MKNALLIIALTTALAVSSCSTVDRSRELADPKVPARTIALQVCSNCHGVDGNSPSPNFPSLAAQKEAYLAEQLGAFRKHSRSDPAGFEYMWGSSRHLTDEQIQGPRSVLRRRDGPPDHLCDRQPAADRFRKDDLCQRRPRKEHSSLQYLPWAGRARRWGVPAHREPARGLPREAVDGLSAHR